MVARGFLAFPETSPPHEIDPVERAIRSES
jgi:hypothetical protein